MDKIQPKRESCKYGHLYTKENTRWVVNGGKVYAACKVCGRGHRRKSKRKHPDTQKRWYRERACEARAKAEMERATKPVKRPTFIRNEITGCWNWTGRPSKDGYGHLSLGGAGDGRFYVAAHRWFYVYFKTEEFNPMLQIDHLCHNRLCVNPDHLEAVTQEENNRRMLEGPHWRAHMLPDLTSKDRYGR